MLTQERLRRQRSRQRSHSLLAAVLVIPLVVLGWFAAGGAVPGSDLRIGNDGLAAAWSGRGATLGVRFSHANGGPATGVSFYKGTEANRSYVVSLWSGDGALLGRGKSHRSAAKGWQRVALASPVNLAKGAGYVVSYWSSDSGSFRGARDQQVTRDPSVRVAGTVWGRSSGFPNHSSSAPDYPVTILSGAPSTTTSSPSSTASGPASTTTTSTSSTSTSSTSTTTAPPSTSSPTASTGGRLGCAAKPSACGYPDATNTGVPAGTTLRKVPGDVSKGSGWHVDSRGWVSVDGDGAVLENLDIPYNVDVTADNVTIRNVRITVRGDSFGVSLRHTSNATVANSEISSPDIGDNRLMNGVKDVYADATGTRVISNNIWHVQTGVQIYRGLIKDNYIHDMGYRSGDHTNGTTSNGGTGQLTIQHNTIFNQLNQTDAISLFQDFGVEANRLIDDNLVAGGGYSIYGGATPGKARTWNIKITNNRVSTKFYPKGGYYGAATAFDGGGDGNLWSGNIWDDTGRSVGL